MIERTPILDVVTHAVLIAGLVITGFPLFVIVVAATLAPAEVVFPMSPLPGDSLLTNLATAWTRNDFATQYVNSLVTSLAIVAGKIALASMTAFAIVYFRFRGRMFVFWAVFVTLMLPLEVRIVPTYAVATNAFLPIQNILDALGITALIEALTGLEVELKWNLLDTYWGLTLPLIATATGTFLFRQFFLTVPNELAEAAKMDGAGPLRFFLEILMPLSRVNMAALAVIMFVVGWNQYLWPLMITTRAEYRTLVVGLERLLPASEATPEWNVTMAGALLVMLPPVLVVVLAQRWFVKGLANK